MTTYHNSNNKITTEEWISLIYELETFLNSRALNNAVRRLTQLTATMFRVCSCVRRHEPFCKKLSLIIFDSLENFGCPMSHMSLQWKTNYYPSNKANCAELQASWQWCSLPARREMRFNNKYVSITCLLPVLKTNNNHKKFKIKSKTDVLLLFTCVHIHGFT